MDKERRIHFRGMFDVESMRFDECLHMGWILGKDSRKERSLVDQVDNDVICKN